MNKAHPDAAEFEQPAVSKALIDNPSVAIATGDIGWCDLREPIYDFKGMQVTRMKNALDTLECSHGVGP